jgi:hypothetical protein
VGNQNAKNKKLLLKCEQGMFVGILWRAFFSLAETSPKSEKLENEVIYGEFPSPEVRFF